MELEKIKKFYLKELIVYNKYMINRTENTRLRDYFIQKSQYYEKLYKGCKGIKKPKTPEYTIEGITNYYDAIKSANKECAVLLEQGMSELIKFSKDNNIEDSNIQFLIDFYKQEYDMTQESIKGAEEHKILDLKRFKLYEQRKNSPDVLNNDIANLELELYRLQTTGDKSKRNKDRINSLKEEIKKLKEDLKEVESKKTTKWVVLRHKLKGNTVELPENHPKKSGYYVCTCVYLENKKIIERYLQVMYYHADKNYWSDRKSRNGISHTILAWRDDIKPCKAENVEYIGGGYFI